MAVIARITVGRIQILDVNADPNGTAVAPKGSLAADDTNVRLWQNQDGASLWVSLDPTEIVGKVIFNQLNG